MSTGAQYVVAAYAVIWFLLLAYLVVLAARTARITRELEIMARLTRTPSPSTDPPAAAAMPVADRAPVPDAGE